MDTKTRLLEVMTTDEVSNTLGIPVKTVIRLSISGELLATRLPGRRGLWLYRPADVEAYKALI